MNSNNNSNNKKTELKNKENQNKKCINPFSMDIKDDIYNPFDKDIFEFEPIENNILKSFRNVFDSNILSLKHLKEETKEDEKPKENESMEEEKEEEINTDKKDEIKKVEPKEKESTFYSKVCYSSFNNLNGEQNKEFYQSKGMKQIKDGHDISETKEEYKNSNGVHKTAYQRGLDGKTTRFIKEKNNKNGKYNEHKVLKGIEENEIEDFNKEYNDYSKQCNFRKNMHKLDLFYPFVNNKKGLTDGKTHFLNHKLRL